MKKRKKTLTGDFFAIVGGGIIWAFGINIFTVPNDIAPGGATGLATLINHFTGFPVGISIIIINVPLFIFAFFSVGRRFVAKTAAAIVLTSLILDIFALFLPSFTEDRLLASVFGGALSGLGLGIIYMRGIATGGSDLLARLIDKKLPALSYAGTILLIDFVVVAIAAVCYKDWRSALYAVITIVIAGALSDRLLAGMTEGKLACIITEKSSAVSSAVLSEMKRGATLIPARGCYTGKQTAMLLITVRNYELPRLKSIVSELDGDAFMIIASASEIRGRGFPLSAAETFAE